MSTIAQAFTNPIVIAVLALALYVGCQRLWKWREIQRAESAQRAAAANAAIDNLACAINAAVTGLVDAADRWDTRMAKVEKLLADAASNSDKILTGSTKACEAIAVATDKHRATVEEFSKTIFGKERGKEALEAPSDLDKDRAYREMQYRAEGKTSEEAADAANIDLIKEGAMYPSE